MNLFRRPAAHYGKTPQPETPYQKAAQIWDERIGSARVQAKNWRYMAFGSLILSAGFAAALVWQSARGTVVPWVVQVDNLGQAQSVAAATADYRPTDPQVAWHLARFVEQAAHQQHAERQDQEHAEQERGADQQAGAQTLARSPALTQPRQ